MQSHLGRLSHSLNEMHNELRAARDYEMKVLEQLVHKVNTRLRGAPPPPPTAGAALPALQVSAAAVDEKPTGAAEGQQPAGEADGAAALAALGAAR